MLQEQLDSSPLLLPVELHVVPASEYVLFPLHQQQAYDVVLVGGRARYRMGGVGASRAESARRARKAKPRMG